MKYSIILPYYKRSDHFYSALTSFAYHYKNRNDYEVIVVEDIKNIEDRDEHIKLIDVIEEFKNDINITRISTDFKNNYNPAPLFNVGVEKSSGEYLVISNPEIFHYDNVLKRCDEIFEEKGDCYIVCSCLDAKSEKLPVKDYEQMKFEGVMWYQHSEHRNALFHFCSCISRKNYEKIGGFDNRFALGYAYDDDDFRNSVIKNKILIAVADSIKTIHIHHDSLYDSIPNREKLLQINKTLCDMKAQGKPDEQINEVIGELRREYESL